MSGRLSAALQETWRRDSVGARMLVPVSWAYRLAVAVRNEGYDLGLLRSRTLGMPTVSVGNLSVGGTGKTPMTSWVASHLHARGVRPAILLRGYRGEDETLVHRALAPSAIVVADPDRGRGATRARLEGAEVAVLDDGFQHRRARRDLDLVLVAAEQGDARRLLPAGPLREGRRALRRADVLVITRKVASRDEAADVATAWSEGHDHLLVVVASLSPLALVRATPVGAGPDGAAPGTQSVGSLAGRAVLAISAIGAPDAFERQLAAHATRVDRAAFPDHHPFADAEVAELARRARAVDLAVCTLKDAVKLRGRWPREAPPLWYLSQVVAVEWGEAELRARLDAVLASRTT